MMPLFDRVCVRFYECVCAPIVVCVREFNIVCVRFYKCVCAHVVVFVREFDIVCVSV